jgi:hypothetical protein
LEHAGGSGEKEQPRESYRLSRDGNAQVRRLGEEFVIGRTPQSMDQRIAENKQGGSKKSWRKSTSAKGSTPTESNCGLKAT